MNDVSIVGRFVKPIEVKDFGQEKCVINNVVAVGRRRKSEAGQNADFIPVTIWGKTARVVEKYCQKGNMIGLSGRLSSRQYDSSDGKHHFVVEMVVEDVHLVEGKRFLD
ncbi:single-stranded DNA-binding protein [Carnobacteriaceae bacterium zg-ZUI252]|nr:single-stranded DNA-binding protein [Carnobacteriaceae bacterium zg-ZUI252]MBS4769809.1 single-stranded DNA-binding protein [Carnobacteriaceae bacterium zg-ZUI240]QTU82675.1 single-stranded DNA-binding protein [Carnobacteriaceae bacterium zg-C25]